MTCIHANAVDKTFKNGTQHRYCPDCNKHVAKDVAKKIAAKSCALKQKFGDSFYTSSQWLKLRYETLAVSDRTCALCGSKEKPLHVDHIKPRSKYPTLALEPSNMQILCAQCNRGKSADYEHDFRGAQ